ncbi:hypothetical protein DS67_05570 [Mesotoga sp. SC_4PWA21]|jgi:hypothetical protein|uniref:hypothetical protein n=1 Tax=unclassified Mesotoga TaxID=1184398 RepID=UPI000DC2FB5E|nr:MULTISPECIES: hypothetical protein [unclassified Mesotoga]RAM60013.1 hypothetical protein DS67_05570 [Mesotoga sp. SC_4PWA21]
MQANELDELGAQFKRGRFARMIGLEDLLHDAEASPLSAGLPKVRTDRPMINLFAAGSRRGLVLATHNVFSCLFNWIIAVQ